MLALISLRYVLITLCCLIISIPYTLSHPPLSTWNYRELMKWRKIRKEAEATWKTASSTKNSTGIRKAHALYYEAYKISERNDTESFYDYAYTAAVGCIYQNFPNRSEVQKAVELDLGSHITTIIPWVRPDPTFYSILPPWTMEPVPLGYTPIPQLVAMTMLDSTILFHVTRAWASAFQFPGPYPIDRSPSPDYSPTQIDLEGDKDPIATLLSSTVLPPIRIIYFSSHLGDHPVGHHISTLLRLHNRQLFRVVCVFTGGGSNNITNLDSPILERNKNYCDEWIDDIVMESRAKETYSRMKELDMDIVITLDGYDRGHRMDILSVTPNLAFQINYFGFLSTLGADYIQGIMGDITTIPNNNETTILYREPFILRHPTSFFVTDYQTLHPEVMDTPAYTYTTETTFTYCSFSQLFKINPDLLHSWLLILEQTRNTKLILPDHPPVGQNNLIYYIQNYYKPINPAITVESLISRIEFLPILPRNEHIVYKRQHCTLGLDTPYYNGHTSTTDLLFGGVPVLTLILPNSTMAGRAAASLIRATNGPEVFITYNYSEYIKTAVNVYQAYENTVRNNKNSKDNTMEEIEITMPNSNTVEQTIPTDTNNKNADITTNPSYLWRPTFDAPLFQREQWVKDYEYEIRKTFFTYLKEFRPNNRFFRLAN